MSEPFHDSDSDLDRNGSPLEDAPQRGNPQSQWDSQENENVDEHPVMAELVENENMSYHSSMLERETQNQDRWWTAVVMTLVSLVSFLMGSGIMLIIAIPVITGEFSEEIFSNPALLEQKMADVSSSRLGLFLILVLPQITLVLPCLIAAALSPVPFKQRLGLVRGNWPIWSWFAVGAASPLVGILSGLLVGVFLEESESLQQMSEVFRNHGNSGFFIPLALMIGATPAFCEELLFRGYIQQRLTRSFRPSWGILIASFLFAAFHMDFVHVVAVFPLGLFLGWITWRCGSLIPAMLGHFVNNFVSVIGIVVAPEENQDVLELPAATLTLSVFVFGLIGMAMIAVAIYRDRTNSETAQLSNEIDETVSYSDAPH